MAAGRGGSAASVCAHDADVVDHRTAGVGRRVRCGCPVRRIVDDRRTRAGRGDLARDPRRRPFGRRRAPGQGTRARRSRGHPRPDQPGADDDRPRLLDGRPGLDGPAAADADGVPRLVHREHPIAHPPRRREAGVDRRPARRLLRRRRRRSADRTDAFGDPRRAERARRGRARTPVTRSGTPRHPAVHQRVDERAEGRDDPRSRAQRQHRRVLRSGRTRPRRRDGVVAPALSRHGSRRAFSPCP